MVAASWPLWTTTVEVHTEDPERLAAAVAAVEPVLAAVAAAGSRFDSESEVCALAASPTGTLVGSRMLLALVSESLRAARITCGAVDPTLGHALVLLDGSEARVSAGWTVEAYSDWHAVSVDEDAGTVTVPPGTLLDLGCVAKAYAADLAAAAANAVIDAPVLVSLGGDIACYGGPWLVGVAEGADDDPAAWVELPDGGIATSTTLSRRFGAERTLHHLLNPATLRPAAEVWRTATVAAASCLDANIASTAAVVMGTAAPRWLADQGLPARLVAADGSVRRLGGWPAEAAA